jgi:hypothetical protein
MNKISMKKLNNLLLNKYKAEVISKQQFKNAIYGFNREDISDDISILSEGIITNENAVYYLIKDTTVLNNNCKCVNPQMYPSGQTIPAPLSGFMPYIVFVAELSEDKQYMVNYARWGSFGDNLFEELYKLELETENEQIK